MLPIQLQSAISRPIQWTVSGDPEVPYRATIDHADWQIQLNDFPAEALYTLLIDRQPVGDLEEWPAVWHRP